MGTVGVGLGAAGIGGFAPTFRAPGLTATTGSLGFEAMGGGGLEANALCVAFPCEPSWWTHREQICFRKQSVTDMTDRQ